MSRIVELAQAIERELEDNRHMIMELNEQLDEEKKCRRKLLKALENIVHEFQGEE